MTKQDQIEKNIDALIEWLRKPSKVTVPSHNSRGYIVGRDPAREI